MSLYAVMRALTTAAKITEEACKQDLLCPNPMQNIYVLTTPAVKNAEAYGKVKNNPRHQATCYCCLRSCARKHVQRGRPQHRRAPHGHST
ncbi:hypothetical protein HPB48_011693 [Haemaphysalis longicornis]|uniref:Uncharacterized protein n=1 Tax=Haemaphysalis longicornis TaxID=44386 RepID=A0A9J6GF95_HAELO|nr:hypothetical protein HPB48_011693 [Haemaphysalis longicornis]